MTRHDAGSIDTYVRSLGLLLRPTISLAGPDEAKESILNSWLRLCCGVFHGMFCYTRIIHRYS